MEVKSQKILSEAAAVVSMSDKEKQAAMQQKQRAEERAERANADAQRAREAASRAEQERGNAAQRVESMESKVRATQGRYRAVFMGIVVFTVTIAILSLVERHSVLAECGKWFTDRWDGAKIFLLSLKGLFLSGAAWIGDKLPENAPPFSGAAIAGVVALVLLVALVFALIWLFKRLGELVWKIQLEYCLDGGFKAIITVSAAISLFYVCLYLYQPIKSLVSLNIFSVWLLMSIAAAVIINGKELIKGIGEYIKR